MTPPLGGRSPESFTSLTELDDAVARGVLSFARYWTLRAIVDERESQRRDEQRYDLVDPHNPVVTAGDRFVAPPPVPPAPRGPTPQHGRPMVPAPPPASPWPVSAVQLPIAGPSADAGDTRARERRRRWRGRRGSAGGRA